MIRPFMEKAEPSTRILLMEDRKSGGFSTSYLKEFGNLHATDVTEENNLWNILSKY